MDTISPRDFRMLADAVLAIHVATAAYVVCGLVLIPAGRRCGWRWVDRYWFRWTHLAAVAVIVADAWLGVDCPLTSLEAWLRHRAGEAGQDMGLVARMLQRVLYYELPDWVFTLGYTVFGVLVLATWWRYPPKR